MKLDEILHSAGKYKARKRLGRGIGSGQGKTAGRGTKGFWSRSGAKRRFSYEGGQNPILARIPKRGFSNVTFRKSFQIVNVCDLEGFNNGDRVDGAALIKAKLIEKGETPVKVLGNGKLTKKLTVVAAKFSASAAEKIAQAGGAVETA